MLNGFLLFTVLDVWRMILSLGLTLVLLGTLVLERMKGESFNGGLKDLLAEISSRTVLSLLVISGVIGMLVPWGLGYESPLSSLDSMPWSYEEVIGFVIAGVVLWRASIVGKRTGRTSIHLVGVASALLLIGGLLWVGRWDMVARGHSSSSMIAGWQMAWDWSLVMSKFFHLLFSSLVAGGLVVLGLGLYQWPGWYKPHGRDKQQTALVTTQTIRYGVGWMLAGLVPQMVVGPWLFLMLHEGSRGSLIDGMGLTSLVFFVSLTFYLLALVFLNATFMVPHVTGLAWVGLLSAGTTLVLMGVVRYAMVGVSAEYHRIPSAWEVVTLPQLLPVMAFILLFIGILVRWCVWPLSCPSLMSGRLDK